MSKPSGAIVDVIPTDGSNIDDINCLPHAVKMYTERDDFYPSSTEVKSRLYVDFRDMHKKQDDDKHTTDSVHMRPNNPIHVSYLSLDIGPLHFQFKHGLILV